MAKPDDGERGLGRSGEGQSIAAPIPGAKPVDEMLIELADGQGVMPRLC